MIVKEQSQQIRLLKYSTIMMYLGLFLWISTGQFMNQYPLVNPYDSPLLFMFLVSLIFAFLLMSWVGVIGFSVCWIGVVCFCSWAQPYSKAGWVYWGTAFLGLILTVLWHVDIFFFGYLDSWLR